jgi:hypothetical protein
LRTRSRVGDRLERLALVRGVALHRLDQVRDQVIAALQLDVDLRPRVLDAVAQGDEPVVEQHQRDDEQGNDAEDDPEHGGTLDD